MLAAQLARFPELRTVVVDRRDGPLAVGQADGVACRTMEMFEAFGLAGRVIRGGLPGQRGQLLATRPLRPRKGRFGLVDHEKVFCHDPAADHVFDLRGIDRDAGAVVVVRPGQYVAQVVALNDHHALDAFLGGVLLEVP